MQEMLQNCIHLQNTEPAEMISCILIVLLLADDRSKRIKLRINPIKAGGTLCLPTGFCLAVLKRFAVSSLMKLSDC